MFDEQDGTGLNPRDKDRKRGGALFGFVMDALRRRKKEQAVWMEQACNLREESDLVFTNEFGKQLHPTTISKAYKKIVDSIGAPEARFHDLRHTYAVTALRSGDDVKTVQQTLGHHTAAFTLDVYGHVTEEMKRESVDRMDAFYQGLKAPTGYTKG